MSHTIQREPIEQSPKFADNLEAKQLLAPLFIMAKPIDKDALRKNLDLCSMQHNRIDPRWERLGLLFAHLPAFRGKTEWYLLPITGPNWVFGFIVNAVCVVLKLCGDLSIELMREAISFPFNLLHEMWKSLHHQRIPIVELRHTSGVREEIEHQPSLGSAFVWFGIKTLLTLLLLLPIALFIATLAFISAQPFYLLFNTFTYIRHLVDAVVNFIVSLTALIGNAIGLIDDKAQYASLFYCLVAMIKNALLLAPIALLIAFSIVPFFAPVGPFVGGIVLNASFTTVAGGIDIAILFGFVLAEQAFATVLNFVETAVNKFINFLFPASLPETELVVSAMPSGVPTEQMQAAFTATPAAAFTAASPMPAETEDAAARQRIKEAIGTNQAPQNVLPEHFKQYAERLYSPYSDSYGLTRLPVDYAYPNLDCQTAYAKAVRSNYRNMNIRPDSLTTLSADEAPHQRCSLA